MISKSFIYLCFISLFFIYIQSISFHHQVAEFCWKNSKTRGAGTVPSQCSDNQDKIGLLCYPKCPNNYKRFGFDCHSVCPNTSGWRDDGLFCRLTQYGRGAGYAWKFEDGLSDSGMKKRCESANGKGNCQKNGAIYYPKCRSGYSSFGCCICRPKAPDCNDLGMNSGIDLSCAKKIIIGKPSPAQCPTNKVYSAGLCYKKCPSNYVGVGPVCWGQNPNGWVNCGMGSASSKAQCAKVIFDQVASVGGLALNIATLGVSTSASQAAQAGKDATKLAQLKKKFEKLKEAYESAQKAKQLVESSIQNRQNGSTRGDDANKINDADPQKLSYQDMIRISAQIAAILDPTGVADIVASYTYSTCDKIQS